MMVADCRHDENYNEDFLSDKDKRFLSGFDACIEDAIESFFDNDMGGLSSDSVLGYVTNLPVPEKMKVRYEMEYTTSDRQSEERVTENFADYIRLMLLEWIESKRNEFITSMIDNMDEEEYARNVEDAIARNKERKHPKEYTDTRSFFKRK